MRLNFSSNLNYKEAHVVIKYICMMSYVTSPITVLEVEEWVK